MRRRQVGITLIELLIAVAIVAILAAIAYPNYRQYALRGNRTEAKVEMMEIAQELEKCYTRFGSYISANCVTYTDLTDGTPRPSEGGRYLISLDLGRTDDDTYFLQAVPQAGQAIDTCRTLTLDEIGTRGHGAPADPDPRCW